MPAWGSSQPGGIPYVRHVRHVLIHPTIWAYDRLVGLSTYLSGHVALCLASIDSSLVSLLVGGGGRACLCARVLDVLCASVARSGLDVLAILVDA